MHAAGVPVCAAGSSDSSQDTGIGRLGGRGNRAPGIAADIVSVVGRRGPAQERCSRERHSLDHRRE
jgi:hypothetical protein